MPDRPHCLPGCNRLDGHDGRDAGACMSGGRVLYPGPLDLVHNHPDIPVFTPVRNDGVLVYDMVLPKWPGPEDYPYTPMRNIFRRRDSGKACYALPSGNMVHVKPACRC